MSLITYFSMETLYIYIYLFIYVYTGQCVSWNLTIRFRIKIVQCSYLMLATVHRSFFSLLSIWVRNKPQAAIVSLCFKPSFPPLWLCQQLRRKHGFVESFCQRVLTFLLLKILDKEVSNGSDFGLLTLLECHDNPFNAVIWIFKIIFFLLRLFCRSFCFRRLMIRTGRRLSCLRSSWRRL